MASSNSPFVVYALPRSRTAWLAAFLSVAPWQCHHDAAIDHGTLAQMQRFYAAPFTGSVETGAVVGWRAMQAMIPGLRVAVVLRPVYQVDASLRRLGITTALEDLFRKDQLLREVAALPGVLSLEFPNLGTEAGCRAIFEHCTGLEFDRGRWEEMADRNIQLDIGARINKLIYRQTGIANLKAEAAALEATL